MKKKMTVRPPKRKANAEATIASAIEAIRVIHGAKHVAEKHKKLVITTMLWKVTEATWGKRFLPYRTRGALTSDPKLWRHEHVFPRGRIVERVLAGDAAEIEELVKRSNVACLVNKAEARKLDEQDRKRPELEGWARYREAGIFVHEIDAAGEVSEQNLVDSLV